MFIFSIVKGYWELVIGVCGRLLGSSAGSRRMVSGRCTHIGRGVCVLWAAVISVVIVKDDREFNSTFLFSWFLI